MAKDPEILAHLEWLGFVQPVGLIVSIPALSQAQAYVNKNIVPDHQRFLACLADGETTERQFTDFPHFTRSVLNWEAADLLGTPEGGPVPDSLEVALVEYGETLKPSYAVREFVKEGVGAWLMLIQEHHAGTDFDKADESDDRRWNASPQARFERLLRETQIPIGLLTSGTHLRLVYAPRGESSGHVTFRVADMATVAGRPIFAALHMLLCSERLFTLSPKQRLPAILADSRKYQNLVSTQLADQVLAALFELLRGFQAADDARKGELLREPVNDDPNEVYRGLLTVLMRLVFVLYAEDRNLLSSDPLYTNHYSITGLFNRLRADAGRFPDTMDQRYGAWAQLLVLFRIIFEGAKSNGFHIPGRKGYLFDPDRYPFLEGRSKTSPRAAREPGKPLLPNIPRISDGVIYRVLQDLLILDGERLSYRTLDVEQIGSVYEAIMGFRLEIAAGRSIAIKPAKRYGAPATINLEALLEVKSVDRTKWLKEHTDQKFEGKSGDGLKNAKTIDALLAALDKKIARHVTSNVVPMGAMVLQPSDERRRSGSHYTPRSLTEPIVRKTFEPILKRLGDNPTPEQLLDLKICDPAMGSGAFLVEACRQLGDELVKAWHVHNCVPKISPDEDELLHARRVIAQRCLYGVDKNPMAVDLAKLSIWLATLAKDHPFTFLDHSLRTGDSLVGLTGRQIAVFDWESDVNQGGSAKKRATTQQMEIGTSIIAPRMERVSKARMEILDAGDSVSPELKAHKLAVADEALDLVRFCGDLCVAAFFSGEKDKERRAKRDEYLDRLTIYLQSGDLHKRPTQQIDELRIQTPNSPFSITPFHWEIEFPEVFGRNDGGFDAFVGNPPFAGRTTLSEGSQSEYIDWLQALHAESHGNSDLVAHFFRRSFNLLRTGGCFGLIATNTVGQGDTRHTGLRWICAHGGTIYAARRRYEWPGQAAVVVSVVHICNGYLPGPFDLDDRPVPLITAYLFHAGGNENPDTLAVNAGKSFQGCVVVGLGFTFDDTEPLVATPIAVMEGLIAKRSANAERIFPYIGGEDLNEHPTHQHRRYIINFGDLSEDEARMRWPDLMYIVEQKVKPYRTKVAHNCSGDKAKRAKQWWQFARTAKDLYTAINGMCRVLVCAQTSKYRTVTFLPTGMVYDQKLVVFRFDVESALAIMQSQVHEHWARFFGSTLEDRPVYTPTDCFETFPFPVGFAAKPQLDEVGRVYNHFRAALMVRNNEGLTKTYNRFHDPYETSPDIARLRELHSTMDRAVLDAYGWSDIPTDCQFLLDYEEEEDDDEDAFSLASTSRGRKARNRKKPWRYRWPDEIRDEVLARLLALNAERAEQERLGGAVVAASEKKGAKRGRKATTKNDLNQEELFS